MTKEKIHFIGIGGSGMAPLAELAHSRGFIVQGSDPSKNYQTENLAKLGIKIFDTHSESNIDGASRVVFSSAIKGENPELVACRRNRIKLQHRSDFLKEMMQGSKSILVSGTHGKTSTTAMIGHMLKKMGLDPIVVVGGIMNEYGSALINGRGKIFVAEADESDGSFLKYEPTIAVVTNIDQDHLDYYKGLPQLCEAFLQFICKVPKDDGCAVLGWDDANVRNIAHEFSKDTNRNKLAFGFFLGSDVRCLRHRQNGPDLSFVSMIEHEQIECLLPCIGRHNVQNALAALAVARALNLNLKDASRALQSYQGVARRLSLHRCSSRVTLIDDYAHNPGKIAACIQAVRDAYPKGKIVVAFQPHRFSRLQTMYRETVSAFSNANAVYVLPVYSAGESKDDRFLPRDIATEIEKFSKVQSFGVSDFSVAASEIERMVTKDVLHEFVVVTVGAGDIWKLGKTLESSF